MNNISFITRNFPENNIPTIGIDFFGKCFQLSNGSIVDCGFFDTAGQERFNALNESYYRQADGIVLVYDISNRKSFEQIRDYYCNKIKECCRNNIPIMLIGNKTDMEDKREVTIEEGIALALSNNCLFKETSALKNENISDAFEALIELCNIEYHKKVIYSSKDTRSLVKSHSSDFSKNKDKANKETYKEIFTLDNDKLKKRKNNCC